MIDSPSPTAMVMFSLLFYPKRGHWLEVEEEKIQNKKEKKKKTKKQTLVVFLDLDFTPFTPRRFRRVARPTFPSGLSLL